MLLLLQFFFSPGSFPHIFFSFFYFFFQWATFHIPSFPYMFSPPLFLLLLLMSLRHSFTGLVSFSYPQNLLELTGAKVVSHSRSANLAIGLPPSSSSAPSGSLGTRPLKVTHLSEKWVLDSIQHHKIQDFAEYVLSEANGGSKGSSASSGSISLEEEEEEGWAAGKK